MVQLHWPTIRRHSSQNALKHLASLEADFQALDASVKLNVSKQNKLPSSFQKDISKGIFQALTDHDYPYEISEADRTLIGGLLLKHITVEAVDRARDRIPLRQYRGLHKSFQTLATKFKAKGNQSHLNQMTKKDERGAKSLIEPSPELGTMHARRVSLSRQAKVVRPAAPSNSDDTHERAGQAHSSRGRGRDATKAAIAIDRPKKKGRRKKKRDEVTQAKGEDQTSVMGDDGGILETMDNRHRVQEVDVHETFIDSGVETNDHEDLIRMFKDIEAQCEQISLQLQDLESGQLEDSTTTHVADELIEGEDVRKINLAEEDDAGVEHLEGGKLVKHPSDATQGPSGQADNRKRLERNELFLQDWEVKEELEDPDASSLITFNIEHQAAVNQLDDMDSNGILRKLSSSLETMRSLVHDVPHFIRFTNAMLLDNGNLEVHAHAESKDDIERLSRVRGWDYEFEKSISTPIRTYAVETSRISLDSFNWQTSKKPQRLENSWRKIYTSRFLRSVSMIFETFVGARSTRRKMVSSLSFVRLSKPTRSSIVVYSFTASATHVSPLVKNFATAEDVKPMVTMRKTVYLRAGAGSVDRSILRRHVHPNSGTVSTAMAHMKLRPQCVEPEKLTSRIFATLIIPRQSRSKYMRRQLQKHRAVQRRATPHR